MTMTDKQRETATKILNVLDRQTFRDFYEGIFCAFLEDCEVNRITKQQILEEITALFREVV